MAIGVEIYRGKVRISFKWQGKRVYETTEHKPTAAGLKAAGKLRAEIVQAIKFEQFNYAEYFPNSRRATEPETTFYHVALKYVEIAKHEKAVSTCKGYRKMINNYWLPIFGHRLVNHINAGHIRDAISASGLSELSPKTFNNAMTPLRGIFDLAVDYEYVRVNPCNKIKAIKWQPPLPDPVDQEDIPAILGAMRPDWRSYFEIAFGTGMRPSELLALRWSDIDFNDGTIKVERGYVEHTTSGTKTHKARFVQINPLTLAGLTAQKPHTFLAGGLVFTIKGKQIVSEKPPRLAWDAALKKAGIRHRKAYATRQTFASIALSSGINPYEVAKQMGNSVPMLMAHYAKWIKLADGGVGALFSGSKSDSKRKKKNGK